MDASQDAPSTPEWRPLSRLAGGLPSAPSSIHLQPLLSPLGERSSSASGDYLGMAFSYSSETTRGCRDIAPLEDLACERITEQILLIAAGQSVSSPSYRTSTGPGTLEKALKDAAITIRFNAKWFAEAPLATLLETALDAAAASSASVDLYAGVHLIQVVGTYSLIPSRSLPQLVQFLAQTYYNATRASRTVKLADAVWKTLQQLLESHLVGQCVVALLGVLSGKDSDLDSRIGYARFAGALMLISEKLIMREDVRRTLPTPDTKQLLDNLWSASQNGTDNVREFIMEILAVILTDVYVIQDLDERSSWDVLIEITEPCVAHTPNSKAAQSLVDRIVDHIEHFECRQYESIAHLLVIVDRPLIPRLSEALISPWSAPLPADACDTRFVKLVRRLSASMEYTKELTLLVDKSIDVLVWSSDRLPLIAVAKEFHACINRAKTTKEATAILGASLIKIFMHFAACRESSTDRDMLFYQICGIASKCIAATRFLFRVRADVEGVTYVGSYDSAGDLSADPMVPQNVFFKIPGIPIERLDEAILSVIQSCDDWEMYDCCLTGLAPLLGNHALFSKRIGFVKRTRELLCDLLDSGDYLEPPPNTGLTKSYLAVQFIEILTAILSYHRHLSKQDLLSIVSMFLNIAGSRDYSVSIPCVHALTICCYELPDLMGNYMDDVIDKMSKMVTQRYLAIHVLVFLAGLSRLPDLFRNFQTHDYKKIFGVCGSYLQSIRGGSTLFEREQTPSSDRSGITSTDSSDALPQYVYALAHHVIAFWYLALGQHHRQGLKEYITSCLKDTATDGHEVIEDQGLVTIDLMDRVDVEDGRPGVDEEFDDVDGRTIILHRIDGMFLITTETALRTSKTVVTIRRPTGTGRRVVRGREELALTMDEAEYKQICVFPEDYSGRTYGSIRIPSATSSLGSQRVISLPEGDEAVTRAIQSFDRTSALDSHKAGVIYIGEDQTTEDEILQNVQGSPDYVEFIEGLGDLMRLKNATFNAQGLDRTNDADGQHAIVWHNEITELVFHVTTLMPNNPDVSLNTANKKRHIGNDFVNIIFNNSGLPFAFNTFPSQFNSVYILISPSARTSFLQTRLSQTQTERQDSSFYKVRVLTRPGYPAISSATEEKVVSAKSLPGYVRNLALNDCVFALMWSQRGEVERGEYPSSWRSRLEQIRRFGERYG